MAHATETVRRAAVWNNPHSVRSSTGLNVEGLESGLYLVNLSDERKVNYRRLPYHRQGDIADKALQAALAMPLPDEPRWRGAGVYRISSQVRRDRVIGFDETPPSDKPGGKESVVYQLVVL